MNRVATIGHVGSHEPRWSFALVVDALGVGAVRVVRVVMASLLGDW
jgi:hypothetical protein